MITFNAIAQAARLCVALYAKLEERRDLPTNGGLGALGVDELLIVLDRPTDGEAFLCVDHTQQLVTCVVRGSERPLSDTGGWRDWINNFRSCKVPFYGGLSAHAGYAAAARALAEQLLQLLGVFPDYRVRITGHSLGGSVALLLAIAMAWLQPTPRFRQQLELITFGQRKVASRRDLLMTVQCQYARVQNGGDVACRTPLWFGYGHYGRHVYYPHDKSEQGLWWINPSRWAQFVDQIPTVFEDVLDHSIKRYSHRADLALIKEALHDEAVSDDATRGQHQAGRPLPGTESAGGAGGLPGPG
ncbi:MAG TPA: lipase family protein [Hyphomicrobiales bacterium]|nr:lipase family protein [Hyphomicrobiales bacterium]